VTAPLVSLCCSTYSRPDLFAESLDGLLKQSYPALEIVVLADGGNPESLALLNARKDSRLRWFSTPSPSGMIPAWNKVVGAATGKYFLYCADDDVLCDEAIERQVELLEGNPGVGFCHADFFFVDDDGNKLSEWTSHEGTWIKPGLEEWPRYLCQPKACMQTCVVRRSLWQAVGGWDEDAGYPGDNSLYLKLLRIADVGHVRHFACRYRVRTRTPDSWAKNASKVKEDVALAAKHLAAAPAQFAARRATLERRVRAYFCRSALDLLADERGAPAEREQFRAWARDTLRPGGLLGAVRMAMIRLRLERPFALYRRLQQVVHGLARPWVVRCYRFLGWAQ
jgi:glycosyltransferase involved in cell wall biosynthesis